MVVLPISNEIFLSIILFFGVFNFILMMLILKRLGTTIHTLNFLCEKKMESAINEIKEHHFKKKPKQLTLKENEISDELVNNIVESVKTGDIKKFKSKTKGKTVLEKAFTLPEV